MAAIAMADAVSAIGASHDCTGDGFLPPNTLKWSVNALGSGITESRFNELLDRVDAFYRPQVAARGARLVIDRLWQDPTVNAYAERAGNDWHVKMYGGLARHSAMTEDGLTLIACHEVGHHLGGAPKYRGQWAANEGQADYFATLKCLREVFKGDDNSAIVAKLRPPQSLVQECERSFGDAASILICERSGMAGLSAAELMRALSNAGPIDFSTPDPRQVSETQDSHPAAQCRLDTYAAGAVCQVASSEPVSEGDATVGVCSIEKNFKEGVRPQCWYKPTSGTPSPQPPPNPQPQPGGVARKPTLGGSDQVTVQQPFQTLYFDFDVSEFPDAGGVYVEISQPDRSFSQPNSATPDSRHLRGAAVRGKRGQFFLNPAQVLPGWGTYFIRIIPLNVAGTASVGRASDSSQIVLRRSLR